ncbi:hypothetical protein [Micromonospora robiginosa]|uniref:DUF305 domain-containing protein n=1 Tax=Micromonospora robiginosa TaxID=2749844 RepID=A0A7L6BEG2_9ACTN|nr:hypothetical protein [Micromonospora ferruginea]QLQ40343.1 hypothetical protein H1D33_14150 [Micromonospora ferruginea]
MLRAGALVALGGAAVPLTGCDLLDRDDEPSPPDTLEPLVTEALALEARHRAAAGATPALAGRLTPIADAHRAHADELRRVIGRPAPSGTPSATPSDPPATDPDAVLAGLRKAEQQGRTNAAKACAGAPAERAALLGSIAAARATHAEALS